MDEMEKDNDCFAIYTSPPPTAEPLEKREAFERSTVMNFTTWFVIAIAIIVPVATFIFHNKE
ncbi:MAG: hypothetical protein J6V03_04920 [Clostridia bacterium]|nr:hypothetical protein [Clostridia bacterium]